MRRIRALFVVALLAVGCVGSDTAVELRNAGLLATPTSTGWLRVESDAGFSLEMPGIPRAERSDFEFRDQRVRRTLIDLDLERGLGAYLAYVYVAPSLDGRGRELLRVAAEERVTSAGERVGLPHEVTMAGTHAAETVIRLRRRGLTMHATVRSLVVADLVVVLAVLVPAAGTVPAEGERYFGSLEVTRTLSEAPPPPAGYAEEYDPDE